MRLPYKESFAYYASCMILFNVIYLLKMFIDGIFCPSNIHLENWSYRFDLGTFIFTSIFIVLGIYYTIRICISNDNIKDKNTLGTTVKIISVQDETSSNFFANFSLLVLTALSLPSCAGVFSFLIYLLIVIAIGSVYTDKNLIYMNPLLSLLHFNIFCCSCKDSKSEDIQYYFFKRGEAPKINESISFQKMDATRRIIRLKK